jgi:hypothetical protein
MTARRETGTSDRTDQLSAADPLTRPDQIARSMVEGGLHLDPVDAAMAEEQPITVCPVEVGPGDDSCVWRSYCSAARGAEVSPVVKLPDLEQWMQSHPECRGHRTRNRIKEPVTSRPPT